MSLEQQMNSIKAAIFNEVEKNKDTVFKGLLENPLINTIPENIFVNYFLPCFLGKVNNPNWVMEWISIAGTPMSEVGVLKEGTNELLYKVPGLLQTNNLFMQRKEGDLSDIFTKYEQINNNLPVNGLSFLLEALNSKNQELLNNISFDATNTVWYDIFKRYNLITESQQTSVSQQSNLNDFLEF